MTASYGDFNITLDYFKIAVDGRIALVPQTLTAENQAALTALGVSNASTLSQVQFSSTTSTPPLRASTLPVTTPRYMLVDVELGVQLTDQIRIAGGANNLFDTLAAEWEIPDGNGGVCTGRTAGFLGAIYPLNHPAGLVGGLYYLRLTATCCGRPSVHPWSWSTADGRRVNEGHGRLRGLRALSAAAPRVSAPPVTVRRLSPSLRFAAELYRGASP